MHKQTEASDTAESQNGGNVDSHTQKTAQGFCLYRPVLTPSVSLFSLNESLWRMFAGNVNSKYSKNCKRSILATHPLKRTEVPTWIVFFVFLLFFLFVFVCFFSLPRPCLCKGPRVLNAGPSAFQLPAWLTDTPLPPQRRRTSCCSAYRMSHVVLLHLQQNKLCCSCSQTSVIANTVNRCHSLNNYIPSSSNFLFCLLWGVKGLRRLFPSCNVLKGALRYWCWGGGAHQAVVIVPWYTEEPHC